MIGPWLAAKTPTRSAMGALFPFLLRVQARDELGLRHAADLEVEAQQIGVDQRRDFADVVLEQGLADVRLDLVAADHARHGGAIFSRQLRVVVQIEEQLAHPVIAHRRPLLPRDFGTPLAYGPRSYSFFRRRGLDCRKMFQSDAGPDCGTTLNLTPVPFTRPTSSFNSAGGTFSSPQITIRAVLSLFPAERTARSNAFFSTGRPSSVNVESAARLR